MMTGASTTIREQCNLVNASGDNAIILVVDQ
jgi:hypothetical protein